MWSRSVACRWTCHARSSGSARAPRPFISGPRAASGAPPIQGSVQLLHFISNYLRLVFGIRYTSAITTYSTVCNISLYYQSHNTGTDCFAENLLERYSRSLMSLIQRWAVRKYVRQIANPKICELNFFKDLRTFRKCGNLRICDLQTLYFCDLLSHLFFAYFKLPQIHDFYPYKLSWKCSHSNLNDFGF